MLLMEAAKCSISIAKMQQVMKEMAKQELVGTGIQLFIQGDHFFAPRRGPLKLAALVRRQRAILGIGFRRGRLG